MGSARLDGRGGRTAGAWALLAAWILACATASLYAAGWPTDNRLESWVGQIEADPGYAVLQARFGGDEFVVVRAAGIDLEQTRQRAWLESLGGRLAAMPAVEAVVDPLHLPGPPTRGAGHGATPSGVAPGQESGASLGATLAAVAERPLARALDLVNPAAARLDLLLSIRPGSSPAERADLASSLEDLSREAAELGFGLRAAGHPLVAAALDREAARVERVFAPLLVLLSAAGVALLLRSLPCALLAILPAILASSGSRAALRLIGIDSDLILVAAGPLTFVLLLASTLHLVTAFRRHQAHGLPQRDAARAAAREKLPAGLLAALSTAVGFGVFLSSGLRSVATLGATVAVTMLLCVPIAFLGLPPLLGSLPLGRPGGSRAKSNTWRRLAARARRRRPALAAPFALLLLLGALAPTRLRTETNALHYFPRGHPVARAFVRIEAEGTPLSTAEVLVRREGGGAWPAGELPAGMAQRLATVEGVAGVFGPEAVLEDLRRLPLASAGAPFALRAARRVDAAGEWARWTVRFPTTGAVGTRALVARVEATAEAAAGPRTEVLVTGSVPLMLRMQGELLGTLAGSLALTALASTALFLLVVRSVGALAAALCVNLFPVAGVLASAWLADIPLDGATVMVAAVVLGLAVDNTFHLMHAAHAARAPAGGPRPSPLRARLRAFERVGRPAAISSLALALGFCSLAFSGFAPTARFGLLCAAGSAWALVADLVLLPMIWLPKPGRRGAGPGPLTPHSTVTRDPTGP